MTWGIESNVIERFTSAGVSAEKISFVRDTFTFNALVAPAELVGVWKKYYGPMMSAFEAAEKNGRADELQRELEALFEHHNKSPRENVTAAPATFFARHCCTLKQRGIALRGNIRSGPSG